MDVALPPLLASLRRYDPQLYLKWNPKKRGGRGLWELRRKPEHTSIRYGRMVESPRGKVCIPGNIFEMDGYTLTVPQHIETSLENHVKDFLILDYGILNWLKKHDLWGHGERGKYAMRDAEYNEAKYDEKIDEDSYAEKQYMIKQHKTQFNDFREYILAGGNPDRLLEYWNQ